MNLSWIKALCGARALKIFPALLSLVLALASAQAYAYSQYGSYDHTSQEIALTALPVEAKKTLQLIKQGGPFPYSRDSLVFGNYENRLPKKQRGYYREYTVKTPGIRSRGARRIVCGQSAECYYSNDHYETFKLIRE